MHFDEAMATWKKAKETYISNRTEQKNKTIVPRVKVTYSVPTTLKAEADAFMIALRHKADGQTVNPDETKQTTRKRLAIEFEKLHPPPAVRDFS